MVDMADFAQAFGLDSKSSDTWTTLGKVTAVSGTTLTVKLGGSSSTTTCEAYCLANVDDIVFVLITDGKARAVAVKGGLTSTVQNKLATITSTANEVQITSMNGLRRLCLTGNNNVRVDTRASTSDSWASLYYPSVLPDDESTIENIVTQTSTQSTNNPITLATYRKRDTTVMVEVRFKPAAARSAGTAFDLGTIVSGKRPAMFASGGSQTNMARITTAGGIQVTPRSALTANTEYALGFTYLLA